MIKNDDNNQILIGGRPFGSLGPLMCDEERSEYLKTAIAINHCPNIKGYASFCNWFARTNLNK